MYYKKDANCVQILKNYFKKIRDNVSKWEYDEIDNKIDEAIKGIKTDCDFYQRTSNYKGKKKYIKKMLRQIVKNGGDVTNWGYRENEVEESTDEENGDESNNKSNDEENGDESNDKSNDEEIGYQSNNEEKMVHLFQDEHDDEFMKHVSGLSKICPKKMWNALANAYEPQKKKTKWSK